MRDDSKSVAVAGHICLDIIPTIAFQNDREHIFTPGKLIDVGAATLSSGGVVANTGLALYKLGVTTRLIGKVGNDVFGRAILSILADVHGELTEQMIVKEGEHTSYTIVISPPAIDRIFLHFPGANDTFVSGDLDAIDFNDVGLFHFGYPPLMRRMFADGGLDMAKIFRQIKARGITTSLDMAMPDPATDAGRADWPMILQRTLPFVDVFLPTFDEILYMLHGHIEEPNGVLLNQIATQLLDWGAGIVGIKLGDQGLYLRTSASADRLLDMGSGLPSRVDCWRAREMLAPCFQVQTVGTTGAGDCTVAGFLAALLDGAKPEEALTRAVAVGACSVESTDSISGIPSWSVIERRLASGWERRSVTVPMSGWHWNEQYHVWYGASDAGYEEATVCS